MSKSTSQLDVVHALGGVGEGSLGEPHPPVNARQLAIVRAVADELGRRPMGGRLAEALREQLAEELARLFG